MYIIPQRAKKSTNKIIKFDKKFTVSGVISIYLAYTIKNEVSNSRVSAINPCLHYANGGKLEIGVFAICL